MKLIKKPTVDTTSIGSGYLLNRRTFVGTALASAALAVTLGRPSSAQEAQLPQTVTSKDGTRIAFDRYGEGPALLLIGGALSERSAWAPMAKLLATHFSVFALDRRGRGDSGNTLPYAVEREIEDIEALIDEAGGAAFIHGQSSGAVLSLESSARYPHKVQKLSLYEPPFIIDDSRPPPPADFAEHIDQLLSANQRGGAVEYWMADVVGAPAEVVTEMKASPAWPALEAVAHTLPYDIAVLSGNMAGNPLPAERWVSVSQEVLVMDGGASPDWIRNTARTLADILPNAEHRSLDGQMHDAAPDILGPELERFFLA
jgi:pimeloyl-ACP methyl ester carboxylesterase